MVKLESDRIYIVVSDEKKTIYLWNGAKSSVRETFIAFKKAQELQAQTYRKYKIVSLSEGTENDDFKNLIGLPL